jgi:hypothetical protein
MIVHGEVSGAARSAECHVLTLTTTKIRCDCCWKRHRRLRLCKPNNIRCNLLHLGHFVSLLLKMRYCTFIHDNSHRWLNSSQIWTAYLQLQQITYKKVILKTRPDTLGLASSCSEGTHDLCTSPVSTDGDKMRQTLWHYMKSLKHETWV